LDFWTTFTFAKKHPKNPGQHFGLFPAYYFTTTQHAWIPQCIAVKNLKLWNKVGFALLVKLLESITRGLA
jgi:hypothetical protein